MQTYVRLFINHFHTQTHTHIRNIFRYVDMCLYIKCSVLPSIRAAECDNLPDPPFGDVSLSGNSVDDVATYVCDHGFELVGQSTRTCQQLNAQTADWSGEEPVCRCTYAFSLIIFTHKHTLI